MPSDRFSLLAAILAASLALPPLHAGQAMTIAMPLCGGGVMLVRGTGKPAPADPQGACHTLCAARRDDDDGD